MGHRAIYTNLRKPPRFTGGGLRSSLTATVQRLPTPPNKGARYDTASLAFPAKGTSTQQNPLKAPPSKGSSRTAGEGLSMLLFCRICKSTVPPIQSLRHGFAVPPLCTRGGFMWKSFEAAIFLCWGGSLSELEYCAEISFT